MGIGNFFRSEIELGKLEKSQVVCSMFSHSTRLELLDTYLRRTGSVYGLPLLVSALVCMFCDSKDLMQCQSAMVPKVCEMNHDRCYSLVYESKVKLGNKTWTSTGYLKACGDGRWKFKDCKKGQCNFFMGNGYTYCDAVCCYGNKCNKDIEIERGRSRSASSKMDYRGWVWPLSTCSLLFILLYTS